jgi:hypothetical protein
VVWTFGGLRCGLGGYGGGPNSFSGVKRGLVKKLPTSISPTSGGGTRGQGLENLAFLRPGGKENFGITVFEGRRVFGGGGGGVRGGWGGIPFGNLDGPRF